MRRVLSGLLLVGAAHWASAAVKVEDYPVQAFVDEFGFTGSCEDLARPKSDPCKGTILRIIHARDSWSSRFLVLYEGVKQAAGGGYPAVKDIFAYSYLEDHGGLLEKWRVRDMGNVVYFPEWDVARSEAGDYDGDGLTEFYVVYAAESDGLDAKPTKVIVYNADTKYKATAWSPAGNPEDEYHVEHEAGWERLPPAIREHADGILAAIRASGPDQ